MKYPRMSFNNVCLCVDTDTDINQSLNRLPPTTRATKSEK